MIGSEDLELSYTILVQKFTFSLSQSVWVGPLTSWNHRISSNFTKGKNEEIDGKKMKRMHKNAQGGKIDITSAC